MDTKTAIAFFLLIALAAFPACDCGSPTSSANPEPVEGPDDDASPDDDDASDDDAGTTTTTSPTTTTT
ncbi:MAG: hypothetical protein KJ042_16235, partial [Deltaproteobacteria bacterium]|nr:hypothetical protein [Deltaproteobacteria bacterium]